MCFLIIIKLTLPGPDTLQNFMIPIQCCAIHSVAGQASLCSEYVSKRSLGLKKNDINLEWCEKMKTRLAEDVNTVV